MWTFPGVETIAQDVRYAARTLRRSPGFTLVAVFALAVGIGSTTAIFSVMNAVRRQALPFPQPDRLVELWGNVVRTKVERRGASYPDYLDWQQRATTFDGMAAFDGGSVIFASGADPERIRIEYASARYFSLLGAEPQLGRTFTAAEDTLGSQALVAVVSDGFWKTRFGADPSIVGRQVRFDARLFTIVGVMPPGFTGLTDAADAWFPFAAMGDGLASRGNRGFAVLARLRPDVAVSQAQAELDAISRQLEQAYPDTNAKRGVEISPLDVELLGEVRDTVAPLMTAVAFVLLIAFANVANLLIARSEVRQREIAIRTAIGAGWRRLVRQLATEGCVLAAIGAAAGTIAARASLPVLMAASPVTLPSFVTPGIDLPVALFTIAITMACGVLLGIVPAAHVRLASLADALKDSARGSGGRSSQWLRSVLVVAEVSLAVVLLVGAGLMIRTVQNLAALDPGFDAGSVLTLRINAAPSVSTAVVLERLRTVPGVAAASFVSDVPLASGGSATFYSAEGQPPVTAETMPRAYVHRVTPEFFATMRIPMKSGRTFFDSELTRASNVVVVSERLARRFWPGEGAVGKRIKFGTLTSQAPWLTIVGVVGETKYRSLPENPTPDPDLYLPYSDQRQTAIVMRTNVPPTSVAPAVRAAIRAVDATIPVFNVEPLDALVAGQTAASRFTMWLMGVFAAAAMMLAVVGIYGVMSYLVTQRTREIGIRLALGATGGEILRLVVGSGARLIGIGVVVGVSAAFALQRLASTLLFGVTAADTASLVAVAILAVVALAACYVPALRAARVDPLHALHYE